MRWTEALFSRIGFCLKLISEYLWNCYVMIWMGFTSCYRLWKSNYHSILKTNTREEVSVRDTSVLFVCDKTPLNVTSNYIAKERTIPWFRKSGSQGRGFRTTETKSELHLLLWHQLGVLVFILSTCSAKGKEHGYFNSCDYILAVTSLMWTKHSLRSSSFGVTDSHWAWSPGLLSIPPLWIIRTSSSRATTSAWRPYSSSKGSTPSIQSSSVR